MSAAPEYIPLSLESITKRDQMEFDVFLQLGNKYVLYVRKGAAFDASKIEKMREKNLRNVFVRFEDGARFQAEAAFALARKADEAYDPNSPLSLTERSLIVQKDQQANVEAFLTDQLSLPEYDQARSGAKRFTEFLYRNKGALRSVVEASRENTIAAHGIRVAALALSIAKELGLHEAKDIHLLALGCLIHDCGHYGSSIALAADLKALPADQQKAYKEHTARGVRTAQELVHFDQHVLKIILEHEELIDGTGYPKGLIERHMHPYSVIAATANSYDKLVFFQGMPYAAAVKQLILDKIGRHPLPQINALKKIAFELGEATAKAS